MKKLLTLIRRYAAADCCDLAYIVPFTVGMALIIYFTA